ncbi:MAG: ketopantoate reductase family protein [Gulosibacter sp.]|uniref:ketopantoate reductase family protein n=1 Tax=Gulosibacter sp. TaxID=2817531 RepID=UPI003F93EDD7
MNSEVPKTKLRVAVLGTGANGSIIGSDLAESGVDVSFIDQWPENIEAIREHGIRVQLGETTRTTSVAAYHLCQVSQFREPFDVVFLVSKAYDTSWMVELIKPLLHADSVVVGVQNGMTADTIAERVGSERTLGAVIESTAAMYVPGLVERHSTPDRCWFAVGAIDPAAAHHVSVVADLLRRVGVVEETDDIQSAKWMKLILNAAELVTSAVLDLSIAECARFPGMREFMLGAGDEAIAVAQAVGYEIRPIFGMEGDNAADPASYVATVLDELVENYILPHSRSTVLQDWMKYRRSEAIELNGEVVRRASEHGLAAPINQAVTEIALQIERGELKAGIENFALLEARVAELREGVSEKVPVPIEVPVKRRVHR